MLGLHAFEHGHVGRIGAGLAFLAALQTHFLEQDLPELLRRADGEGLARLGVDLLFQPRDFLREAGGETLEMRAIDLDAGALHLRDDGDQRPVDQLVDARRALAGEARLEARPQAQVTSASSAA